MVTQRPTNIPVDFYGLGSDKPPADPFIGMYTGGPIWTPPKTVNFYKPTPSAAVGETAAVPGAEPVSLTGSAASGAPKGFGAAPGTRAQRLAYALQTWPQFGAPKSIAEAAVQGIGSGLQGYMAGSLAKQQNADKAAKAQRFAAALYPEGDPRRAQVAGLLESGDIEPGVFGPALMEKYGLDREKPIEVGGNLVIRQPNGSYKTVYASKDPATGASVYDGTSMDAQNWNIILGGKADTPEYAAAYNQLFQTPKMAAGNGPNGEITQTPYFPPVPPGVKRPGSSAALLPSPTPDIVPAGDGAVPAASGVTTGAPIATGQAKPTEAQVRNRQLFSVASKELPIVEENFDELGRLGNQAAAFGGNLTLWATSPGYQKAYNSLQTIIASYLYSTSGATANPAEVIKQTQVLMPFPGESTESIADKKRRIRVMTEAIQTGAKVSPEIPAMPPSSSAPEPPRIKTDADYNALPSGTTFIDPEGTTRVKP